MGVERPLGSGKLCHMSKPTTMRPSNTFNISLPPDLAAEVDRIALEENRSRSDLFREAFRRYVDSRRRWDRILQLGPHAAASAGLRDSRAVDAAVDRAVRKAR